MGLAGFPNKGWKCVAAPDVYMLPGVDPGVAPRCWKMWESGVAPSFALEIMSEIDDLKDVAHAPPRHDELGTKELVVFDPYIDSAPGRTRFRVHHRGAGMRGDAPFGARHGARGVRSRALRRLLFSARRK